MLIFIFKLIATAFISLVIALPLINGSAGSGILREVEQLGVLGASVVALIFLILMPSTAKTYKPL